MSSRWDSPNAEPQASASSSSSASTSAAAAAAAAAAKIAAQFATKAPNSNPAEASSSSSDPQRKERETHDAEFTHDIEINDQRNRYMLTKGQTQQQIHRETGASVTTKGTWYPDKALATKEDPPLYLHVEAISQQILDAGIAKINEFMAQEVPQLVEDRHQRRLDYESQRPPPRERRRWPEEKVPVNLESIRNFNVRSKIVGPGGMFVKYIQNETGTRVQIKGLGSGFIESDTGMELNEPMHIAIAGPEDEQIQAAKVLADDLMEVVRAEWQKAYDAMGQGYGGGGGRGGYGGGYDGGAPRGGGYGRSQGYGRGGSPAGAGGYGGHQQHQHAGYDQQRGGWNQQQQQPYSYNSRHNGDPAPPTDDGAPPPPPPEDDAPPPPPTDSASYRSASASHYQQQQRNGTSQHAAASPIASQSRAPAAATPAKSPEEEALDKYWREYVQWEDSFRAYHSRAPTKDEGGQDVPPQYRK
ncbi:hypothetical protein PHSY_007293 [Pseudozyma hubeiensis SY62]|uniref:K Homology domain-containing protein n=1 Tax=Pseudozyma hubeiensis (strain SY62) TaxID=1305764 RepID=R9PNH1_PSEHS|nr:hypothetical protein PHSY_007293 [Pseudozyma hubeiensis SY62]GAC99690.1 hypothetical protein PHSY_007293 [Pseudozyma hubeiensis SY62]